MSTRGPSDEAVNVIVPATVTHYGVLLLPDGGWI